MAHREIFVEYNSRFGDQEMSGTDDAPGAQAFDLDATRAEAA